MPRDYFADPIRREENPYQILGVERTASAAQIKRSYRALSLRYHPDKHDGDDEKAGAQKVFQEIKQAYERVIAAAERASAAANVTRPEDAATKKVDAARRRFAEADSEARYAERQAQAARNEAQSAQERLEVATREAEAARAEAKRGSGSFLQRMFVRKQQEDSTRPEVQRAQAAAQAQAAAAAAVAAEKDKVKAANLQFERLKAEAEKYRNEKDEAEKEKDEAEKAERDKRANEEAQFVARAAAATKAAADAEAAAERAQAERAERLRRQQAAEEAERRTEDLRRQQASVAQSPAPAPQSPRPSVVAQSPSPVQAPDPQSSTSVAQSPAPAPQSSPSVAQSPAPAPAPAQQAQGDASAQQTTADLRRRLDILRSRSVAQSPAPVPAPAPQSQQASVAQSPAPAPARQTQQAQGDASAQQTAAPASSSQGASVGAVGAGALPQGRPSVAAQSPAPAPAPAPAQQTQQAQDDASDQQTAAAAEQQPAPTPRRTSSASSSSSASRDEDGDVPPLAKSPSTPASDTGPQRRRVQAVSGQASTQQTAQSPASAPAPAPQSPRPSVAQSPAPAPTQREQTSYDPFRDSGYGHEFDSDEAYQEQLRNAQRPGAPASTAASAQVSAATGAKASEARKPSGGLFSAVAAATARMFGFRKPASAPVPAPAPAPVPAPAPAPVPAPQSPRRPSVVAQSPDPAPTPAVPAAEQQTSQPQGEMFEGDERSSAGSTSARRRRAAVAGRQSVRFDDAVTDDASREAAHPAAGVSVSEAPASASAASASSPAPVPASLASLYERAQTAVSRGDTTELPLVFSEVFNIFRSQERDLRSSSPLESGDQQISAYVSVKFARFLDGILGDRERRNLGDRERRKPLLQTAIEVGNHDMARSLINGGADVTLQPVGEREDGSLRRLKISMLDFANLPARDAVLNIQAIRQTLLDHGARSALVEPQLSPDPSAGVSVTQVNNLPNKKVLGVTQVWYGKDQGEKELPGHQLLRERGNSYRFLSEVYSVGQDSQALAEATMMDNLLIAAAQVGLTTDQFVQAIQRAKTQGGVSHQVNPLTETGKVGYTDVALPEVGDAGLEKKLREFSRTVQRLNEASGLLSPVADVGLRASGIPTRVINNAAEFVLEKRSTTHADIAFDSTTGLISFAGDATTQETKKELVEGALKFSEGRAPKPQGYIEDALVTNLQNRVLMADGVKEAAQGRSL